MMRACECVCVCHCSNAFLRYNRHALIEVVSCKMGKLMSFSSAVLRALLLFRLVPHSALRASQTSPRLLRSPLQGSIHKLDSPLGLICPQFTPATTSDLSVQHSFLYYTKHHIVFQ